MNINISAHTEDKQAIQDYAKTLFLEKDFITLNNKLLETKNRLADMTFTEAMCKIFHSSIRSDLRTPTDKTDYFIHCLTFILNNPEVSLDLPDQSEELENLKAFNLFMLNKGYLGFLHQDKATNVPKAIRGIYSQGGPLNTPNQRVPGRVETVFDTPERQLRYRSYGPQVLSFRSLFESKTQITKEALLKKYNDLVDIIAKSQMQKFFYYKVKSLPFVRNNTKIVSTWSKKFLKQFDLEKVHALPKSSINNVCIYSEYAFQQYSSRSYNATIALSNRYASCDSQIKMGPLASFSLIDPLVDYEHSDNFKTQVHETILNSTQSRIEGFSLPSYKKTCLQKPFYEKIHNYTRKQALKRNGFFIPFLVPVKYLTESMSFETVFFYTFVFFDERQKLLKKLISKETLTNFNKKYVIEEGVYFYDYDSYLASVKKSFGPKALAYSESFLEILKDLSQDQIESLKTRTLEESKTYNTFDSSTNAIITAKPKIDPKLDSKYKKFKTKFLNLKSKKCESFKAVRHLASTIDNEFLNIKRFKQELETMKSSIKAKEEAIKKSSEALKLQTSTLENLSATYFNTIDTFEKIENEHEEAISQALTNASFSTSSFFNALAGDNIKLLNIKYKNTETDSQIIFDIKKLLQTSKNSLKEISQIIQNENNLIEAVEFLIDRPVKIIVDSKPNKFVFGGPYLVKVVAGSLLIKLAYPNSLFGYNPGNNNYLIHPHCSRLSFSRIITCEDYARACLGEAQPLIWDAFKKNDLKLIILSAMTWVNSANSTDTWGTSYKYFPTSIISSKKAVQEPTDEITTSEVQDFLEAVTDETEETLADEIVQEPANEELPYELDIRTGIIFRRSTTEPAQETEREQAQEIEEDLVEVASTEQLNNSHTYVRYTPI